MPEHSTEVDQGPNHYIIALQVAIPLTELENNLDGTPKAPAPHLVDQSLVNLYTEAHEAVAARLPNAIITKLNHFTAEGWYANG